jgi:hypothetical protein
MENQERAPEANDPTDASLVQQPAEALQQIPKELMGFIEDEAGAKKFLEAAGKFRASLPKMTKPEDWVQFGETVYLQEQSLMSITNYLQALFQYNITILKPDVHQHTYTKKIKTQKEDGTEDVQEYEVHELELDGGIEIEDLRTGRKRKIEPIMGSCSTDDPFFGRRHGQVVDADQISRVALKKKAQANYRGNCFRLFWGLKGMTMDDLTAAGLDSGKVHDSTRKTPAQQVNAEDKTTLEGLWERILKAHYGVAEDARKWLQASTAYGAYKKKDGSQVNAFAGVTDINRVKMGYGFKKLKEKVDELEKNEAGAEVAQNSADKAGAPRQMSANMKRYNSAIQNARNEDEVYAAEQHFAKDASLSKEQIAELQQAVSLRLDYFASK